MKEISELYNALSYFLDWNKVRVSCLAQIFQVSILPKSRGFLKQMLKKPPAIVGSFR
jgi:hypothetical protein